MYTYILYIYLHIIVLYCNDIYYLMAKRSQWSLTLFMWHMRMRWYARWYHWKCGWTQLETATINQLHPHAVTTFIMFSCSGLWYIPMYYHGGVKALVNHVQWSNMHIRHPPTQDRVRTLATEIKFRSSNHMHALPYIIAVMSLYSHYITLRYL